MNISFVFSPGDGECRSLLCVFSYLTTAELCRVARVCRKWYTMSKHPDLWLSVSISETVLTSQVWGNSAYSSDNICCSAQIHTIYCKLGNFFLLPTYLCTLPLPSSLWQHCLSGVRKPNDSPYMVRPIPNPYSISYHYNNVIIFSRSYAGNGIM